MKKITYYIFFFLLIGFLSCKEDDPCQDCYKNIFHCKINGQYWEPYCEPDPLFGCSSVSVQYYSDSKFLSVVAHHDLLKNGMTITIQKLLSDTSKLQKIKYYHDIYSDITLESQCIVFRLDTLQNLGLKLLSHDLLKRRIKANFSLIAVNICGDTIRINEGYFYVNY